MMLHPDVSLQIELASWRDRAERAEDKVERLQALLARAHAILEDGGWKVLTGEIAQELWPQRSTSAQPLARDIPRATLSSMNPADMTDDELHDELCALCEEPNESRRVPLQAEQDKRRGR